MKLRHLLLGRKAMTNLDNLFKKQWYHFANKDLSSQSYDFSSSHVQMWELNHKEGWAQNCCFWIVVLEKILESPLDYKEIKPVNPKGNHPWIFIGREWCSIWRYNISAVWCKEPTQWKRSCCWGQLKVKGEGGYRGRDGRMASLTQWDTSLSKLWEIVKDQGAWYTAVPGVS